MAIVASACRPAVHTLTPTHTPTPPPMSTPVPTPTATPSPVPSPTLAPVVDYGKANLHVMMSGTSGAMTYSILGTGFAAGENVNITLRAGGTDVKLGTATANASGAFELSVDSATLAGLKAGVYTVKATGDRGAVATAPLKFKP